MNQLLTALLVAGSALVVGSAAQANSLDKPGSLLLFPYFSNGGGPTSEGEGPVGTQTFITVTNTNNNFNQAGQLFVGTVDVEFVYINGENCLEFNRTRRLTPNDTITVSSLLDNPNAQRGYLYVFAKSPTSGAAISWNFLEGDSIVVSPQRALSTNIPPVVYQAIGAQGSNTDVDGDGIRDLNNVEYSANAAELHIPRFIAAPNSSLILIGLTGSRFTTIANFLAYNDNEEAFSGQVAFDCWDIRPLYQISGIFTNTFLQSTNHNPLESFGGNETGWIRMWGATAFSTAQQRSNPAMLAVRVDLTAFGSLPYGIGTNTNGDLLVLGPFYDNN
ncbi:MAG: hypothetical protein JNK02_16020 [Planctomycetes bacterium]|nr:hypothetical protein [Planctomycetota bacterium]